MSWVIPRFVELGPPAQKQGNMRKLTVKRSNLGHD
jgi:hypothetical protein